MRFLLYNDLLFFRMDDLLKATARDLKTGGKEIKGPINRTKIRVALQLAWARTGAYQKELKNVALFWLGQIHRSIL
jgi:hypothetical protein